MFFKSITMNNHIINVIFALNQIRNQTIIHCLKSCKCISLAERHNLILVRIIRGNKRRNLLSPFSYLEFQVLLQYVLCMHHSIEGLIGSPSTPWDSVWYFKCDVWYLIWQFAHDLFTHLRGEFRTLIWSSVPIGVALHLCKTIVKAFIIVLDLIFIAKSNCFKESCGCTHYCQQVRITYLSF